MIKKKSLLILFPVLLISISGLFLAVQKLQDYQTAPCYATEEKIVRGESLSPLVKAGDSVKILFGYYDCHEIKRDDIVAYDYKGDEVSIIKIVKGLPKDKFELKAESAGWNILINGQVLKNSENQPYLINQQG